MKTTMLKINFERLSKKILQSSKIGATKKGGVCRLALTTEDQNYRDLFKQDMLNAGLTVSIDDFGNMYGRREGRNPALKPIVIGSHLDTQPLGGKYDGIYGVLSALEVIETLNDFHIRTEHPIEIVNFTSEEGARFSPPMIGSGGVAKVFSTSEVHNSPATDGKIFKEELEKIGYLGTKENRLSTFQYFIELHIEQGPILEDQQISIGTVLGIQGITWLDVTLIGKSSHAGTTPMHVRKDALLTASKIRSKIQKIIEDADNDVKCTVGKWDVFPNIPNCVPEKVNFTVDIRSVNDANRETAVENVKLKILNIAAQDNIDILVKEIWEEQTTEFSTDLVNKIRQITDDLELSHLNLYSGAGHDAKYMNLLGETAMIFIPSIDGKSHCEDEFSTDQDLENGANVLLNTITSLAKIN